MRNPMTRACALSNGITLAEVPSVLKEDGLRGLDERRRNTLWSFQSGHSSGIVYISFGEGRAR